MIENPNDAAVEFASTKALLGELKKRYDPFLLIGRDPRSGEVKLCWGGTTISAMGYAEYAKRRLYDILMSDEECRS